MGDERTRRAVAAATAAARDLDLTVTDPVVLHDLFSVVVHLAPAPVVARVPTVVPEPLRADTAAQATRMLDELDVVAWLAGRGFPVVAPSPLVPAEPVERDGFAMTFWEHLDVVPGAHPDHLRETAALPGLHAELAGYPRELPLLTSLDDTIPACLTQLRDHPELIHPDELDRARREWDLLAPVVTTRAGLRKEFPGIRLQPIHGDSPVYNVIATTSGNVYADFEMTCLGPVEWDLALSGEEAVDAYDTAAAVLGRPPVDRRLLTVMEAGRMLQVVACLALVPRLPQLADGLAGVLDQWRDSPIAGGLTDEHAEAPEPETEPAKAGTREPFA
ncbi:hypothetical protein Afil01_15540 [Actinorhabdospora filicis]|uniref:Aminoglycoside phosphotransferase domain-containing protein n=1 Tax=Actinorhabdospora filicis TaxID=1785913 RepID=A0A9W6W288_9ACTN|nr:phosphotransferase [Actinorhabdospora filicis]GLZ76747.1 hypothetical protein Afil01_15540 [Actinorhabdospora filicis]